MYSSLPYIKHLSKYLFLILPTLILISLAGFYLTTEYFIRRQRANQAFAIFPYFHWQRKIYEFDPSLNDSQRQRLLEIYQAHPAIYRSLLTLADKPQEKQKLKEKWAQLDPWQWFEQDLVSYYLEQENWTQAAQMLEQSYQFVERIENQTNRELDYQDKVRLAKYSLQLADIYYVSHQHASHQHASHQYVSHQPQAAANWYVKAQNLDQWCLNKHEPVFLNHQLSPDKTIDFFVALQPIPGQFFGNYRQDYAQTYLQAINTQLADDQISELKPHLKQLLEIADWMRWQAWDTLAQELLDQVSQARQKSNYELSYQKLMSLSEVWSVLSQENEYELDWELRLSVAQNLVSVGNHFAKSDMKKTIKAYRQAFKLHSWVFGSEKLWFELVDVAEIEVDDLYLFFDYFHQFSAAEIDWKSKGRTQIFSALIQKLVEKQDCERALSVAERGQKTEDLDYELKQELLSFLQGRALFLLETNQTEAATKVTRLMFAVAPEDYWAQVQPANLAAYVEDYERAERGFETCLSVLDGDESHDDCFYGLKALRAGQPNHGRYFEVAQIIQGQAVWQDFD